ncbi:MAG TPA: hypothetical protein VNF73_17945 [Candidatus Saccharimonadales bacterium]|nr:hypothetical protein [Candidatus Saccharimonadales bacterium]
MALLIFKLGLTPALIGAATLVSRRWGPAIGGTLIALPLTSGPVLFFLALDHGPAFGVSAATGSLAGTCGVAAFCLAYAWSARRFEWPVAFGAACLAYVLVSLVVQAALGQSIGLLLVVAVAIPIVSLTLMPKVLGTPVVIVAPWWDIPARMAVGAALVALITEAAPSLGAQLSGLISTFPVFVTVLAVFTHRREGSWRVVQLMRGVLIGLFGTIAFFAILRLSLEGIGIAAAFALGIGMALGIQVFALRLIRTG